MAENKVDIDRFVQLSKVLTGAPSLDPTTAESYLGRLRAEYPAPVADVLAAFAAIEKDENPVFEVKRRIVGTLRMAKDKQSGVVDSDGRSFDHKNLFVAGSSVFATGAPTNPTITVAALALRTAKAIEQQLAKG